MYFLNFPINFLYFFDVFREIVICHHLIYSFDIICQISIFANKNKKRLIFCSFIFNVSLIGKLILQKLKFVIYDI